jgi:putative ABC transport system permease protein
MKGTAAEQYQAPENAKWVLEGDRGLTFSGKLPENAKLTEGAWWPENHAGEALVSFEVELGRSLGLKIGDEVTVNVLGRNINARVANFRTVKWESLDINFVMIFSPNTLAAAPFNYLGTLNWPPDVPRNEALEAEVVRATGQAFPTVTAVRVRDVLAAFSGVFERVMVAVRTAGSITLAAGVIVLAGALLTAQRRRLYEATVLKTLGATRARIALSHLAEYALLALSLSVFAAGFGAAAAYALTVWVMNLDFSLSLPALLQPSLLATILLIGLGAVGTFRVLSARPASYLRSE